MERKIVPLLLPYISRDVTGSKNKQHISTSDNDRKQDTRRAAQPCMKWTFHSDDVQNRGLYLTSGRDRPELLPDNEDG